VKDHFRRLFPVLMLTFFGIVIIQLGYGTLQRGSVKFIPQDGLPEILSPDNGAAAYWALSTGMCILGGLLFVIAAYLLFRFFRGTAPSPSSGVPPMSAFFGSARMQPLWPILNVALLLLSCSTGYAEMAPDELAHSNPDLIFCTITLVTTIAFSFIAVWYSISGAHQQTLRAPSWRRFSIDWWHDPLQCLFLSCCFAGAMALGAAFRLPGTTRTGFWMFMFFVCLFLGLLIGQLLVYSVHRERITNT
jgi:hypothetical protein